VFLEPGLQVRVKFERRHGVILQASPIPAPHHHEGGAGYFPQGAPASSTGCRAELSVPRYTLGAMTQSVHLPDELVGWLTAEPPAAVWESMRPPRSSWPPS